MNKSEGKGYEWLLKQGYKEEDIVFQRKGIDFICADGKGYEVKKLYGRVIWFYQGQLDRMKDENNTLLVFDDKGHEPIAVIPFMEIEKDKVISGIKATIVSKEGNGDFGVVSIKKEVIEEIKKRTKAEKITISDFLSRALKEREESQKADIAAMKELKEELAEIHNLMATGKGGGITKQDLDNSLLGLESDLDMKMREMLKEVVEKIQC